MFVGLMPKPGNDRAEELDESALVAREFLPLLRNLKSERDDFHAVVTALSRENGSGVADSIGRLAAGEVG